jgi:hypothetical protein
LAAWQLGNPAYAQIVDLTKLKKIEPPSPRTIASNAEGMVTAIVKVKRAGYRPACVKVRGEIDAHLFTAEFPAEELDSLEKDPEVAAVSLSRRLQA